MAEENTGSKLTKMPERDERKLNSTIAPETTTLMADTTAPCENIHTEPTHLHGNIRSESSPSDSPSYEARGHFSKPSLSYIALIAQVILSSSSQKLNLASIYEAMEDQFPYFRSRGQGWRNSVRHNLSVNDCFVKVSRCEDGKGHYWGIHPAHLGDFQQGNFRQHRQARRSRERELYGCLAERPGWMEPNCLWGGFCRNGPGSLGRVEPQYLLQEHSGYGASSLDWPEPRYQHGRFDVAQTEPCGWVRHYYSPGSLPDSHDTAIVGRWHHGQPLTPTWRLHSWEMYNPALRGVRESHESVFMRPPQQPFCLPGCQCVTPVFRDIIKPVPYYVNCFFHP